MSSDLNNGSAVSGTAEPNNSGSGAGLSLRALHEALAQRGVEITYSALSELVNTGDLGEQLGVSGGGNKRAFPAAAVDVLAAFLPVFREAGGREPKAPDLLRRFLAAPGSAVPGTAELVKASGGSDAWPPSVRGGGDSETLAASVGGDELSEDDLAAIGRGLAALDAGQVTPAPVAFAQLRAHLDELKRARRNHGEEVAV